jgi:hypothetical protein
LGACTFGCGQAPQPDALASAALALGDASRASASISHGLGDIHADTGSAAMPAASCPAGMAYVKGYCMDRYEAYVVELDAQGHELPHSPYTPVDGLNVRAKVAAGVVPQGYISQVQAQSACQNAGKRLCTASEFSLACRGPNRSVSYPYGGTRHQRGKCNEGKGSAVTAVFGMGAPFDNTLMNDARLNRWPGGLAKTGAYAAVASTATPRSTARAATTSRPLTPRFTTTTRPASAAAATPSESDADSRAGQARLLSDQLQIHVGVADHQDRERHE